MLFLENKSTITSLELVEQINIFRREDGNKNDLAHSDLLKIIRNEFKRKISLGKISERDYINQRGQKHPMFELTLSEAKQVLIRESETVREAIIYYIEKLEQELLKPISIEDALIQQLQLTKTIRLEQEKFNNRLTLIEAKTATRPEYFTVMCYAILNGVKVGLSLAAKIGRKAASICSTKGYHIDKIDDPRFGQVGCYPADVLQEVFKTTLFI